MEDLFAGSIPSQLSAAPAEKEFTVSEISFEIKKTLVPLHHFLRHILLK